ncbi:Peptidase T [Mannheimia haemolytica]|uniref:Peptidase T n=1 Tax=Mannheimia haemolytica TaxID=75985 RepID=A0A378MYD7_MANHA|nr:Peptidase T [Mannheimia haemolytica]
MLNDTLAEMQQIYGEHCGKVEIVEQYRNMREVLDDYGYLVEIAENAMREQGIEPNLEPIRGGTDGSRLSFMACLARIYLPAAKISTDDLSLFRLIRWKKPQKL